MAAKKPTLGNLVDKLWAKMEERKKLNAQAEEIKKEEVKLKDLILAKSQEEGCTGTKGLKAQFSITDQVLPKVTDWDAFYGYIHENRFFHLLHREASTVGCRELFESNTPIPGVERFVKKVVNPKVI